MSSVIVFLFAVVCLSKYGDSKFVPDVEYIKMPKLFHLDDYDDCLILDGLFCTAKVALKPISEKNYSETWNVILDVNKNVFNYRHDWLRHGICLHKSCPKIPRNYYTTGFNNSVLMSEISKCYTEKYSTDRLFAKTVELYCENNKESFFQIGLYEYIFAIYIFILAALILAGSFYEGMARYKSENEYNSIVETRLGQFLSCFSLPKNWTRLRKENTSEDALKLSPIQGIRTFNTMIVIMAHVVMSPCTAYMQNPKYVEEATRNIENTIVSNGSHSVTTFFMISAFLFSYNFMMMFDGKQAFKFKHAVLAIANRWIRLFPALITTLGFSATWFIHYGSGPQWMTLNGQEYFNCRANWWTNILFINNIVNREQMCLQQTWYLATDTQLFIFALAFMPIILKYKKYAIRIFSLMIFISVLIPFTFFYYYDYYELAKPEAELLYNSLLNSHDWHVSISMPFTNFPSYCGGLLYGYIFYKYSRNKQYEFLKNRLIIVLWWILIFLVPIASILIGYFFLQDDYVHNRFIAALNLSTSKLVFSSGIGLIILGCNQGLSSFIPDLLKWKPIVYLGRLTFSAYLVHIFVIRMKFGPARHPFFVTYYNMFAEVMSAISLSFLFGLGLCLFVEMPATALQKFFLSSQISRKTIHNATKHQNGISKHKNE